MRTGNGVRALALPPDNVIPACGVWRRSHVMGVSRAPTDHDAEAFALHAAAVNQSLAVMSRAGASQAQLRAIVDVTIDALSHVVHA